MARKADPLADYRSRRDFARTREPDGKRSVRKSKSSKTGAADRLYFAVQKHDATTVHYDLRLEFEGVLKSWAVTKGPSIDPETKRLAVRTEDHPLAYGDFEGTIPRKQYGGGTVMLWDTGRWEPLHDPAEGLKEGKLHFRAHGARMKGGWALVRMRPRKGERGENWLLIKERDKYAGSRPDSLLTRFTKSVASDRTMKAIAAAPDGAEWNSGPDQRADTPARGKATGKTAKAAKAKPVKTATKPPAFVKPQLATLVDKAPDGGDWLHEVKFDGYRLLVAVGGGTARCYTRSGLDWSEKFSDIVDAFAELDCGSALIDGEVVATAKSGRSSFSALQNALKTGAPMTFYAFDLLSVDGEDWRKSGQADRKEKLEALLTTLPKNSPIRYSEHVRGHGPAVIQKVCKAGEEGIVAKRADAPYSGRRSRNWLKVKCTKRQEFVIGGFSPSEKAGRPFASILLGTYDGKRLVYRGRVGTGFDEATMDDLKRAFDARARKTAPFDSVPGSIARTARWLTPNLVAEVDFAEFTDDDHIRHGAFIGLRHDKEANAVSLEKPKSTASNAKEKTKADSDGASENTLLGIRISHPDRIVFSEQNVAKIDLARYYAVAAETMLPFVANHPLSLVRCPQGREKACFFQKHASDGFPDAIRQLPIREKSGKTEDYLYVNDAAGLIAAVQMGTLEFHVWGAANDKVEAPDRLIFDLDPDEGLSFDLVKSGARMVRDRLADLGLASVPMVTGGKGVHVIVPVERRADWDRVKRFSKALAANAAAEEPERYTATMSKEKRKGRIFIDWLRNERGATAIAPYSTRSRAGAPIATPVSWEELDGLDRANGFHIGTILDRLDTTDPWAGIKDVRQSLTLKMLKTVDA